MEPLRRPANDPRTLARYLPSITGTFFPYLIPGIVAGFNRDGQAIPNCRPVDASLIASCSLQPSMLFEVAVVVAEEMLRTTSVDWAQSLELAVTRQRRHFDVEIPDRLTEVDRIVAEWVARNLTTSLLYLQSEAGGGSALVSSPAIPGYQWIGSSVGDFSVGTWLIEVKCTHKRFSSADYRQILMYWLLSYASAVEKGGAEWSHWVLLNPRLNFMVTHSFDDLISVVAAGRTKVEILELFSAIVESNRP